MMARSAVINLLLGSALLSTVPTAARAGQESVSTSDPHVFFDNYCVLGSLQVCASVRVFTSADGKTLTMQVWNQYGAMGVQHTINTLGLYHSGASGWTGNVLDLNAYYVTSGGAEDIASYWKVGSSQIGNRASIELELATDTKGNQGIVGCPPPPGGNIKWSTCTTDAVPAYVQFDFSLSSGFSLADLELRWHSLQVDYSDDISLKCDTGLPDGDGDSYGPCQVVPEPVTIALVGTGLVGLGLARRRKRNWDVGDM